LKDIGLKLLAELMKNSKTSDRELATKLGVSQPTVSRIRAKLEREGYIKEYTLIPDFQKLGFEIMAVTLVRLKRELSKKELDQIREYARDLTEKSPFAYMMALDGHGLGYNRIVISLHENYSDFVRFVKATREVPYGELAAFDSFMITLSSEHYMPLTFSMVANYLLAMKERKNI
jgi:DNA-binding Lrp family transcriptional regulator